jgi:hypothetical protein
MLGSLCTRYRVGEPQSAEGMVGNRYLPDDAVVQNREHGKLLNSSFQDFRPRC